MSNDKILLASYGTLRKGYHNSYLVDKGNNHLGTGKTVEKYQMKANGIPYVNKIPDTQIVVDVWELNKTDLHRVDKLEGYNPDNHESSWYKRELIQVEIENKIVEAYIYFNDEQNGIIIKSGNYENY